MEDWERVGYSLYTILRDPKNAEVHGIDNIFPNNKTVRQLRQLEPPGDKNPKPDMDPVVPYAGKIRPCLAFVPPPPM